MRIQRLALVDERWNAVLLENARDQRKIHLRLIRRDVDIAITQPFLAHKLAQSACEIGDLRLRLRRLPELHLLAALAFLFFTSFPPSLPLFVDPTNGTRGIPPKTL